MKRPLDPVVTLSVVILAQARIQYPRYLPSAQPGLLLGWTAPTASMCQN